MWALCSTFEYFLVGKWTKESTHLSDPGLLGTGVKEWKMSLMTAGSCFPNAPHPRCEADAQRKNNHTALGTLLGLHKQVSRRETGLHWKQAQEKVREIQGQVWHRGGPYKDVEVSTENPAKGKMALLMGWHAVIYAPFSLPLPLSLLCLSNQKTFVEPALCQALTYRCRNNGWARSVFPLVELTI